MEGQRQSVSLTSDDFCVVLQALKGFPIDWSLCVEFRLVCLSREFRAFAQEPARTSLHTNLLGGGSIAHRLPRGPNAPPHLYDVEAVGESGGVPVPATGGIYVRGDGGSGMLPIWTVEWKWNELACWHVSSPRALILSTPFQSAIRSLTDPVPRSRGVRRS